MGLDDQVYNRLLRERIIFLGSVVEDANANAICAQLLLLAADDPDKDIWLYINSPGGSVSAGMAIYDTMQWVKNDVATVSMGLAASMGQFLLCAGAPGKRYALPHSRIMMHQPSGGLGGTASDIRIQAEQMLYTKAKMAELIAQHTGQTIEHHRGRLRPRPLVHGRAGAGLRHGRPGRLQRRPGRRIGRHRMTHDLTTPGAPRGDRAQMSDLYQPSSRYVLPVYEERTSYGFKRQDPYNKLFEERIIFLGTQIDDVSANDVMAQLLTLESDDPDRDISIYINSPGGSFTALTAIYDTMKFVRPDIQTTCLGQAASAAAIILAAGTPGKRFALQNSRILIHQPSTEGGGQASDVEIQAREVMRMRSLLEQMLADHSNRTLEQVGKDIERDKILTAEEALEYGLIDRVLTTRGG